jgi:hypothetical protein
MCMRPRIPSLIAGAAVTAGAVAIGNAVARRRLRRAHGQDNRWLRSLRGLIDKLRWRARDGAGLAIESRRGSSDQVVHHRHGSRADIHRARAVTARRWSGTR